MPDACLVIPAPVPQCLLQRHTLEAPERSILQAVLQGPPPEGHKPGDFIIMRAEMNCVCAMSACPSDDICGSNGPGGTQDSHFEVLEEV